MNTDPIDNSVPDDLREIDAMFGSLAASDCADAPEALASASFDASIEAFRGQTPLDIRAQADQLDTLGRIERAFGHRILERYGMTETVMLTGNPFDGPRKAGTVGLPFDGVELRLADPATAAPVVGDGGGEVQVRGPSVTRGYWRDADATRAAFSEDGWFKTGDLGVRDADGYLALTGRARELIISGGFNVYPREIEELIATLPGVREVAVVGVPDADLGERVAAAIALEAGRSLDAATVVDLCKRHLAGFKAPREVTFVTALPRNAMGKLLRHEVRDALAGRG